jgi:protein ATS1
MPVRIVAFGSNGSGQLGIGHADDVDNPTPCRLTSDLFPNESVVQFAAGGNHTLLLTSAGRTFAAGSNESGQCGFASSVTQSTEFHQLTFVEEGQNEPARVTSIGATWQASIFVVDHKRIYVCGKGDKGELGLGSARVAASTPALILNLAELGPDEEVSGISAGVSHVVLSTSAGRLFGWGASRKGQLGEDLSALKVAWEVQEIKVPFPVRLVAAGRESTCIVGGSGCIYWLGRPKFLVDERDGADVGAIDEIASGWTTVIVSGGGKLRGLGRNNHKQLPPPDLAPVSLVAVGSEHTIALNTTGQLLAWGWGEHGNCGRPRSSSDAGATANVVNVDLEAEEGIKFLGAGCATSFVVIGSST